MRYAAFRRHGAVFAPNILTHFATGSENGVATF